MYLRFLLILLQQKAKAAETPAPTAEAEAEAPVSSPAPSSSSSSTRSVSESVIESYSWDESANNVNVYIFNLDGLEKDMVKVSSLLLFLLSMPLF